MYRKKRGGRLVGSWRVMISGSEVNLGTIDAELARTRLRQALERGRRNFDDELAAAAELEERNDSPAAPGPEVTTPESPVAAPPAFTAPMEAPATVPGAGAGASTQTGHLPSPAPPTMPPPPDASDADDMAAAAADVAGDGPANDNGAATVMPIDDGVLDSMLEQGAHVIVDLQLSLQAYAIKRGTGLVAGAIPADSMLRSGAAKAWAQQLKIWFPSTTQLPPWAVAIILPAMALPTQFATARPPTKEELEAEEREKNQQDQPAAPMAAAQ
jgi:hypothetical protein